MHLGTQTHIIISKLPHVLHTTLLQVCAVSAVIRMKFILFLLLNFGLSISSSNVDVEEAFDPDSGEDSYQRQYVISVANKAEECYYIPDVKDRQVINFHFVVSTYMYQVQTY